MQDFHLVQTALIQATIAQSSAEEVGRAGADAYRTLGLQIVVAWLKSLNLDLRMAGISKRLILKMDLALDQLDRQKAAEGGTPTLAMKEMEAFLAEVPWDLRLPR